MYLRFSSKNTDKTSDFVVSTYKRTEIYYNDLQPAENTINVTLPYSLELASFFKAHSNEWILAKLVDTSVIYTGYVRKTYSFVKRTRNQPIQLQLVSPAFILDKELEYNQVELCENQTYLKLINKLLQKASFYSSDKTASFFSTDTNVQLKLNKRCSVALFSENENIKTLLEQICFELGLVYDFSSEGDFKLFPLFNAPVTITQEFNDFNVNEQVSLLKKEELYNNVILKWQNKFFKENALIFSDTQNGTADAKCSIEVKANSFIFDKEINYLNYDSEDGVILSVKDLTNIDVKGTVDIVSFKNGVKNDKTAAELTYENTTADSQTVTQLDLYGDVWLKIDGENQTKATTGDRTKDYNIRFLNSDTDIKELALQIVSYYRYSDFTVELKSNENFAIGSFVHLDCEGLAQIDARVIQKKYYLDKPTEYLLEAVSEYEEPTIRTKSYKKNNPYSYNFETVIRDKVNEVENQVEEISIPAKIELYKRSATNVSSTGITGNANFNFDTNELTWPQGSSSNGWTTNIPAGTNPVYITVASISGKGIYSIPDTAWPAPSIFVKNGEDGLNSAEVYSIIPNYNIVTRYQNGQLSTDKIKFSFYKANASDRGEVTVFYRITASTIDGIWNEIESGSGISVEIAVGDYVGIKCDIYLDNQQNVPLASESIGIVSEGSGAIFADLSNSNVTVSADSDGNVTDFSRTQTLVYVFCGSNTLNYGNPEERGFFTVGVLSENVVEDSSGDIGFESIYVNESGEVYVDQDGNEYMGVGYFVLPAIVGMTANQGSRTVTIRGTSYDGNTFEITTVQTITKVKDGIPGGNVTLRKIEYAISDTIETAPSVWSEERPVEIPQGFYLWTKKTFYDESIHEESAEYSFSFQGNNGLNIATVILYQRAESAPAKPTATLRYYFEKPPRYEWTGSGESKGWLLTKPAVSLSKLPLYEIRATALSVEMYDDIEPSEFSEPVQTQMDNGLTEAETEAIAIAVSGQASEETKQQILESLIPEVSIEQNDAVFAVDENHIVTVAQQRVVTVSCKQNGEDYPFEFIQVAVPPAIQYTVDDNKIILSVKAGVMLQDGHVIIRVRFSPYTALLYGNERDEIYFSDIDNYGLLSFRESYKTEKTLSFTYSIITGGNYFNRVSSVAELPSEPVIGDFFTWAGIKTQSDKVLQGEFNPATVYTWTGLIWTVEKNIKHLPVTLGDALSVADADLEKNNSDAYLYVDHVTSNSVFANLVVAKLVEAELILSKEVITNRFEAIGRDMTELEEVQAAANQNISNILADYLTSNDISDMETKTELEETLRSYVTGNVLSATLANYITSNELASKGYLTDEATANKIIEKLSETPNKTIIDGGFIKTDCIDVDVLLADYITSNEIESEYAKITTLESDYAKITDLTTGSITVDKATNSTNATNVSGGSISGMDTGSGTDIAIHSHNWANASSTTGFGILKNGNSYFNNMNIRGSSTVEGSILCNHGLVSSKVNSISGGPIQNLLDILDEVIDGNQYKETYKYLFQGSLSIQNLDSPRDNIFRCHTNFISRKTYPTEKNYFIMCEDLQCYDVSLYIHKYSNGTYLCSFTRQETSENWQWTNVRINRFRGIL